MNSPEYENKFSDCLFMKLHREPVAVSWLSLLSRIIKLQQPKNSTEHIDLKLTIRFGEQQILVFGGTVTFGLKAGELKLKLNNSKIPLETLRLTALFKTTIEIERQKESSRELVGSGGVSATGVLNISRKEMTKEASKLKDEAYQVYTRGTEEEPVWVFQAQTDEKILRGMLQEEKIGTLQFSNKPASVEAFFEVQDEDVRLASASGIWSRDIGRAKIAWLERELFLRWLRPKLKPYISQTKLLYE